MWHIAKATFAHNTKLKNGRKQTSEISKIHFWGRKIKFSFLLNKKRSNAKKQKKGRGSSNVSRVNLRNSRWEFHHDQSKIIFIYLIQTITKILQFWLKTYVRSLICSACRKQWWIYWIKNVSHVILRFIFNANVTYVEIYNPEIWEITLLNVFDKFQYIPETFIESKRKFDFSTSKMDFRNFWGRFSAIFELCAVY